MEIKKLGQIGACTYFRKSTSEWVTQAEFTANDESLHLTARYAAKFKWVSKLAFLLFFNRTVAKATRNGINAKS